MSEIKYEYQGHRGLPAIARAFGMKTVTLTKRIRRGLSLEEAVSIPVGKTGQRLSDKPENKPKYIRGNCPESLTPLWKLALGMETAK